MPSPFPGMNPYLEQEDAWNDFRKSFIPLAANVLNAQVGPEYIVKIDERICVHDVEQETRAFLGRSDVSVASPRGAGENVSGTAVLDAPVEIRLPLVDVERDPFIEIRDRRNRQLITVLELLSPSNKNPGRDRDQYINKRDQLLAGPVHFVEIDLLRGGPRMPMVNPPECDYYALVSRAERRPIADFWPIRLRQPLPTIPVPLRAPRADLRLDLQAVLHRLYDAAGYAKFIYDGDPVPPLRPDDEAWARPLVPRRV